ADDHRPAEVRQPSEHAEALLGPYLGISASTDQLLGRGRRQIGYRAAHAVFLDKGHEPLRGRAMLLIIEIRKGLHDVREGRMLRNVSDFLPVQPHLSAVTQALDVTPAVHLSRRRLVAGLAASGSLAFRRHLEPSSL